MAFEVIIRLRHQVYSLIIIRGIQAEVGLDGCIGGGDEGAAFATFPRDIIGCNAEVESWSCFVEGDATVAAFGGGGAVGGYLGEIFLVNSA